MKKCGLLGEKLGHSFSKEIHEKLGRYEYELKELRPDELESFIKAADFEGINVTIPYKETVRAIEFFKGKMEDQKKLLEVCKARIKLAHPNMVPEVVRVTMSYRGLPN